MKKLLPVLLLALLLPCSLHAGASGIRERAVRIAARQGIEAPVDIVFVGDSRTVGMSYVGGYAYIAKESTGYGWLASCALAETEACLSDPYAVAVLCFGVNDVGNIGSYLSLYGTLAGRYPGQIYLMSVNPVDDAKAASCGYFARNSMVEGFNQELRGAFPELYIDTYSYLVQNGFGTSDGVHYDAQTYAAIQGYVRSFLGYAP